MIRFKTITILYLVIFTLLYISGINSPVLVYGFLVLSYLAFLTFGSIYITSNFYVKAKSWSNTNEKIVSITFDDGPHPEKTLAVLEVLQKYQTSATFFCIGKNVEKYPEIAKKIYEGGHLIGNHSYSHSNTIDLKLTDGMLEEFGKTASLIKKVINRTPRLSRPPFGVTTPHLAGALEKMNNTVVGWNIRSFDTKIKDHSKVMDRIKSKLIPGSIILLHDTTDDIHLLLEQLLQYLKSENYRVVPLDKLINEKPYAD